MYERPLNLLNIIIFFFFSFLHAKCKMSRLSPKNGDWAFYSDYLGCFFKSQVLFWEKLRKCLIFVFSKLKVNYLNGSIYA